ncbi:MAG: PQQ-binding-like beta-propeller repeat protein [bacterium]|nr:PQQ-binding-like beta-propeller repeat protein [bacterium]
MRKFAILTIATAWLCCSYSITSAAETRSFIAADSSKKKIAIVDESGKTTWEYSIGPLHDLHQLANGNLLFQTNWTRVVEVDPKTDKVVWEYDSAKSPENKGRRIEVHAFQRLDNGLTMIVESGASRIVEVDADGKIQHKIDLKVSKPHQHRDTRLVRKLASGNYLVCHEGDGAVREYNAKGDVVWEYGVPLNGNQPRPGHGVDAFGNQCFAAVRLANGNTLISTGNGHGVIEVTPEKEIVWSLSQNELPGIQFAWVTTLEVLPNGNYVIGNCHAGPKNPQIIEINREKEVVWSCHDFETFGNALTNTKILTINGKPVGATIR